MANLQVVFIKSNRDKNCIQKDIKMPDIVFTRLRTNNQSIGQYV